MNRFAAIMILSLVTGACKLAAPNGFFDAATEPALTASSASFPNLNFSNGGKNGGELWSGFLIGKVPSNYSQWTYALDDGAYADLAVDSQYIFRIQVPVGAAAAAGKNRWQVGSKHTVSLKPRYFITANGNKVLSQSSVSFPFIRQINKDANGDGYADIIVGAKVNDGSNAAGGQITGGTSKGAAYVIYGSSSGMTRHDENATPYYCSGPPDCTVVQNPDNIPSGNFGSSVAFAGDVNGDGYADIVIGASANSGTNAAGGQTGGAANKGAAYIFYGSIMGITKHNENATAYYCSGPPDCTVIGNPDNVATGSFGGSVAFAGDVNGDGYADVIVGATKNNGSSAAGGQIAGATDKGAFYIFYGSAAGITKHDENATAYYCSGPPDCTVIENPDNVTTGSFGGSVAFAGDVNGDDYADIIVGATQNNGGSAAGGQTAGTALKGASYIFYGSTSGITKHDENATAYYCSGAPDCTVIENPDNTGGIFGVSVAFAGDANGDGYADVIVGARVNNGASAAGGQTAGAVNKGSAYIFYGSASGVTKHDENATAYYCSGPPDCTVIENPDNAGGRFGGSVAFAGDVNGDGYADVIVGAYFNNGGSAAGGQTAGAASKGAAYIFYGAASGITQHDENATAYYCSGPPDCTVIENPDNIASGSFGWSVAFAGDANGDGYADVLAGAYLNNGSSAAGGQTAGAANKGAAYIFYGTASGITKHDENATAYYCSGPPDCTVIANPDNIGGNFGYSVAFVRNTRDDGSIKHQLYMAVTKSAHRPSYGLPWCEQYALLRREEKLSREKTNT